MGRRIHLNPDLLATGSPSLLQKSLFGLFALFLAALASPLFAFEMGVTPIKRVFTLHPGETKRSKLQVNNSGENLPLKVSFEVMDFTQGEDGSAVPAKSGSTPWSAASWIKLLRKDVVLGPKQQAYLGFDIQVPPNAKGAAYATILCQSTVPTRRQSNGTSVFTRVQIPFLVYVTVAGTEDNRARITKVKKVGSKTGQPFKIFFTVENQGNVLIRPKGTLTLSAPGDIRKYDVNPTGIAVLPGLSRIFTVEDNKGVAQKGSRHVQLNLTYGGKTALEATGDFDFHD